MTAVLPHQSFIVAILATVIGVMVWWLAETPMGLLVPVAARFLFVRGRPVIVLGEVVAIAIAGSALAAWNQQGDPAGAGLAFFAIALGIGAVVVTGVALPPAASRARMDKSASQDVIHPDDRPAATYAAARAFWTGIPQVMRYRQRQPDGSYRWGETRSSPGYTVNVDVDDLKTDEDRSTTPASDPYAAHDAATIRAARVIEGLFGNAWAFDADGRWIYLPLFAQTTLGLTPDDLNASLDDGHIAWRRLLHPDEYEEFAAAWHHSLTSGEPFYLEHRIRRATGRFAWARSAAQPTYDCDGRLAGWYGTSIDIDIYKKTVEALEERERELTHLVNMVPSYLWRLTAEGEPSFFNKRLVDFFGMDIADLDVSRVTRLAAVMQTVVHPDDADRLSRSLHRCVDSGQAFHMRYRLRRADGVYRWVEGRAEPLRDQDGRIVQWYGLSNDIDDQLRAEKVLRESERSLRQLVETLPALIYCAAPDGKPTYRSRQLRDFLGFGLDETDEPSKSGLTGTLEAIIHPDDRAGVMDSYSRCLATGEPYARKHRLRRFDGGYRWVETRAAAMRDAEGRIMQWNGVCFDIEDQVRAQEELRRARENLAQASQAASLAELSASIAHEVNQPLAAIVANSHACQRWLTTDPPNMERAQRTVARVIRDANAAAEVVSRIRALFSHAVEARSGAALDGIVAGARDLIAEEATRRLIRILVEVEDELPPVALDPVQVQQVLVNLMRNAMEAMDSVVGERVLRISLRRVGDALRTEVSDRGPGVAFPDRIFEPFFTTKGQGMGMGLAICRSIVEAHGGRLWAENNEPTGSTFIFTLPVEAEAAA